MKNLEYVPGLGWVAPPAPPDNTIKQPERKSLAEQAAPSGAPAEGARFYAEGVLLKHALVGEGSAHTHEVLTDPGTETGHPDGGEHEDEYAPEEAVDPGADAPDDYEGGGRVKEEPEEGEPSEEPAPAEEEPEDKSLVLRPGAAVWVPGEDFSGSVVKVEPDGSVVVKAARGGRLQIFLAEEVMPLPGG